MSIFSSIEFDAISRDFNYLGYTCLHKQSLTKGSLVSEAAYTLLARAFMTDMEQFYDTETTTL